MCPRSSADLSPTVLQSCMHPPDGGQVQYREGNQRRLLHCRYRDAPIRITRSSGISRRFTSWILEAFSPSIRPSTSYSIFIITVPCSVYDPLQSYHCRCHRPFASRKIKEGIIGTAADGEGDIGNSGEVETGTCSTGSSFAQRVDVGTNTRNHLLRGQGTCRGQLGWTSS